MAALFLTNYLDGISYLFVSKFLLYIVFLSILFISISLMYMYIVVLVHCCA